MQGVALVFLKRSSNSLIGGSFSFFLNFLAAKKKDFQYPISLNLPPNFLQPGDKLALRRRFRSPPPRSDDRLDRRLPSASAPPAAPPRSRPRPSSPSPRRPAAARSASRSPPPRPLRPSRSRLRSPASKVSFLPRSHSRTGRGAWLS